MVIFQGFVSYHAPWLLAGEQILVIDLYDPIHLEQLEQLADRSVLEQRATIDHTMRVLNEQVSRGDFFLCASEQQRALWLGQLAALGRLNIANYRSDATLRSLIDVCPFGITAEPPTQTRHAIKGSVPGIGLDDTVVIWAGGIYNWFDPVTLIRAVDQVRREHDDIRLFFLGTKHPNPDVTGDEMAAGRQGKLADELGLTGTHVFFNDGWVDYGDRQNYLLDADVGVSTHFSNIETAFSFRTRMLDYLWAGLPMISTEGDAFGALIADEGLGVTVGQGDVEQLAAALVRACYDDDFAAACRARVREVAGRFTWDQALAPLVEFCEQPAPGPRRRRGSAADDPPAGAAREHDRPAVVTDDGPAPAGRAAAGARPRQVALPPAAQGAQFGSVTGRPWQRADSQGSSTPPRGRRPPASACRHRTSRRRPVTCPRQGTEHHPVSPRNGPGRCAVATRGAQTLRLVSEELLRARTAATSGRSGANPTSAAAVVTGEEHGRCPTDLGCLRRPRRGQVHRPARS